jgi:trans-aconitate 2-methyltransferase
MNTADRLVDSWGGRDYERHSSHQRTWGSELMAELSLHGHERILDLGCGDGSLTRQLAERVPRGSVLGIDAAAEMLDAARDKCGPQMAVRHLDITDLDFESEFDVVFSNASLHWVHDHAAVLLGVHRALRPGGVLLAQFGCDGNCPNMLACLHRQMATQPFPHAFAGFRWPWFFPTLPAYEDMLRASRFAEWRARTEHRDQRFPSADAIVGWIDNPCLIPFVQALPAELRKPFRDAVVAAMLVRTRQPDGTYLEPFRRINVWARKPG